MNYTVVWISEAEDELASIWVDAEDRNVIAQAAAALDRELARDPATVGESGTHSQRITYCLPLGIRYEISDADRLVRVLAVWQCRRPNK